MRHKTIIKILILACLLVLIKTGVVSGDTLHSDWIGTLDKSYKLAWQQKTSEIYNGYRTNFFLEHTYLMNGTKKYSTYCIEYYKKGPRGNNEYGKVKLDNTDMNSNIKNGIIAILKNGYPNVAYPYGTTDISEAYYATSAAIHVWTMYHGVDSVAGNNLGWFMFKDGFSMNKNALTEYISDYSTESTASGWHIIGPNNNASSKRTWKAAMQLLIDATEADVSNPYIALRKYKDSYFYQNYIVYEYVVESNYCTNLGVKIEENILGCKIEYTEEKNNSLIAKIYIPVSSVNSDDTYNIHAYGSIHGADDINNYYYLYHTKGEYQTMVYLENDNVRTINSSQITIKIPELKIKTYYDLNYSGKNYIKDGDFNDINALSYTGEKIISSKGNVGYNTQTIIGSSFKRLHVYFNDVGVNNCLLINTLLNGSTANGFKSTSGEIFTLSCWVKSNVKTSLKLSFCNSTTVYEKTINEIDKWVEVVISITKSDSEDNTLCIYTDDVAEIQFKTMQLESGNIYTGYSSENSGIPEPMYSEHKIGLSYGELYNGTEPVRENFVFLGWNTKKDGTGVYVKATDTVSMGHQVLYAIWTTQDTYNIYFHYNANGGQYLMKNGLYNITFTGYEVVSVPNNSKYNIQVTALKKGYDFIGWSLLNNLNEEAENSIIDSVYVNGEDVHLYANFKKTHKVRFHYYDEKSGSEQIVCLTDKYSYNNHPYLGVLILPDTEKTNSQIKIPEVNGYYLKGWTVNKDETTEIDYECGETEDIVLYDDYYALYEKSVTVKFFDNVYDSDNTSNHKGSSYLHKNYNLDVKMNYAGEVIFAEFNLPDDVCEVNGFEFYGWSDSRNFDGSVCYYESEKGTTVQTDTDLRFYSLYVDKKTVKFYDYDFNKSMQHLEKEIYAYEYMNYNGDTYKPDIIIPSPCLTDNGWIFDYWISDEGYSDVIKCYPEDRYSVDRDISYYAVYKNTGSVKCHYLVNDTEKNVIEKVEEIIINKSMTSSGEIINNPVTLPEIPYFEDKNFWYGVGYSDIDNSSDEITHTENTEYLFSSDCHLYAIYNSDIVVNYHDYSISEDIPLLRTDFYHMIKTCDNKLTGVSVVIPETLSSDVHDESWWTYSAIDDSSDTYFTNEEIVIVGNTDLYAWHSDKYDLICNDLLNNKIRKRIFETSTITAHNGTIIPGSIMIPSQGGGNDINETGYWSLSADIITDFWSEEYISLYSDVEINAIYEKQVNLIFDANGGVFDNGDSVITVTKYVFYNVIGNKRIPSFTADCEPYRNGYHFNQIWNTSADNSGENYNNGVSFEIETDLRLYANWVIAGSPHLSVIDRYFFVGDEITYNDIIEKIIAKNEFGLSAIDNVKILKINNRRVEGLGNDEIANKIVTNHPCQYKIDVRLVSEVSVINQTFTIYIIDKQDESNKLRYISLEFIDTFDNDSKWNYGYCQGKLMISLNKNEEDAEYKYVIKKEGVD